MKLINIDIPVTKYVCIYGNMQPFTKTHEAQAYLKGKKSLYFNFRHSNILLTYYTTRKDIKDILGCN